MPLKHSGWDTSKSGKGSDAKIIRVRLLTEEGSDNLYVLSVRQTSALLKISQYLEWTNRFDVLPTELMDKDDFDAWNSQIKQRLMTPVEICAEIINCIENDEDVKAALTAFINSNLAGMDGNLPGQRISTTSANKNLATGTNPACDNDILWAQSLQLVDYTHKSILSFLSKFEEATNNTELIAAMASLPVLDELGVDAGANLIGVAQNALSEGYAADYDVDLETELAVAIFCAAQMDCEVTIERVWEIIYERANDDFTFPPDSWLTIAAFILEVADVVADSTNIAIYMFFLYWGMVRTGNIALPYNIGDRAFSLVMQLAVNDANDDWIYLADCVDTQCYEMFEPRYSILEGEFFTETGQDFTQVTRSTTDILGAVGELNFPVPVSLFEWSLSVQSLGSGTTTVTTLVRAYLGATLVRTLYSNTGGSGGFVWQHREVDSVVGQDDVIDRIEVSHQHNGKVAYVWMKVCFNPIE